LHETVEIADLLVQQPRKYEGESTSALLPIRRQWSPFDASTGVQPDKTGSYRSLAVDGTKRGHGDFGVERLTVANGARIAGPWRG
jgi:hypothetical protein